MITETTVDGVRTLLAHRPGPLTAGLLFRVGRADETLATSGITHLVEHLALHRHGRPGDPHHNGATAAAYTRFQVTGTPAEVVEYLDGVCAALRDLPVERLETEKEILRTEAAGRSPGPARLSTMWRYGSRSYGLAGYAEVGLARLTGQQVRDWARTRFTAGNAVLWITGDTVPDGLGLGLPRGPWQPLPEPASALPDLPAFFRGEDGSVVLTSVLPRSTGASLFAEVLGKELFRELRHESGYSYTATAEYDPRDAGSATLVAHADALPEKQEAMVGAFVDVLAKLRAGRIDPAALESVRACALARLDAPGLAADRLPEHAVDLLMGHRSPTVAEERAEIEAVTAESLHEIAHTVWAGALLRLPGRSADRAAELAPGLAAAPTGSAQTVTGRRHPALAAPGTVLIVGDDGVSLVSERQRITVHYAACSLVQAYPDGARHLVGHDGFTLTVEPALYGIGPADLAPLDAAVPPSVVIAMPPREASRIPRPPRPAPAPDPAAAGRALWFTVLLWALGAPGLLVGGAAIVLGYVMGDEHGQIAQDNAWFLFRLLLLAGVLLIPWGICMSLRAKGKR
nr:insulinase family protein [Streptomyces sp. NBC_00974]